MSIQPNATLLPKPGDLVAQRFRVDRILGIGGMGGVFAVHDTHRDARVALKLMLPHLTESPEFLGRFAREAKAAAGLRTPHVAKVFEIGHTPEGAPFMLMELLEGRDLDQTLRARGPLPIPEAVGFILEACHAVAEAHAHGIVHRDLKPSNLFLANVGARTVLKVLDFGISKTTGMADAGGEGLTATETTLGSPQYMSPEQIRSSKRVDHRSDIWSLGIILQKLLTGRLAFPAESVGAQLVMVVNEPPVTLREARPDAPVELERAILRCLQKDVAVRYQNLGQLAVALAPFAEPDRRPLIDAIIATIGREASLAPPPAIADVEPDAATAVRVSRAPLDHGAAPAPDAGTAPGWAGPASAPRRGVVLGVVAAAALVALAMILVARVPAPAPATSAVPAATEPPTGTASTAASSADDRVTVETDPPDAEVEIDGLVMSAKPLRLPRRATGYRITVRAPGYAPATQELTPGSPAVVRVALEPAAAAARTGHAGPKPPPDRRKRVLLETDL